MKSILIVLLGLAALAASQPVDDAVPADIPVGGVAVAVEAEPIHDMEGSEAGLKFIEHKLDHWLKKCYKKGGCGSGHGYGGYGAGYPAYAYPVPVQPSHYHSVHTVPVAVPVAVPAPFAVPVPYAANYGAAHGLYGDYGGYGGYGGNGGYGGHSYGHGGLGGYGYGR